MKILLDSNAYTELKKGHPSVAELVRGSERILLSTVVAGELLYGFRHGSRFEANLRELRLFLESPYVKLLPVSFVTSDRYSRIATSLRRKGRPIPTNDIWIAAHAMETGAELVSFDEHFEQVEGLAWVRCSSR
ncbi:MAG: type II toxin-antitoxin system VapC family toxin [Vicinamibacteria bacterium]